MITITLQPQSKTVSSGTNVLLAVAATGNGTLTYQWYKNNVAINLATTNSLALLSVNESYNGSYTVTITDADETVTSSAAILEAHTAPFIIRQPYSTTFELNEPASIDIGVLASTSLPLTYQWTKNGVAVGTNSNTLSFNKFSVSDAGDYVVTITNSSGTATSQTIKISPINKVDEFEDDWRNSMKHVYQNMVDYIISIRNNLKNKKISI